MIKEEWKDCRWMKEDYIWAFKIKKNGVIRGEQTTVKVPGIDNDEI